MTSNPKVLYLLVFLCIASVNAETEKEDAEDDGKEISQEDKLQCVKKFVDWCNNMQYPQEGESGGLALLSVSYRDDVNFYRVFCSSDSNGTNCTRNRSPWFSCTPDHILSYKGEVLTETSTDVDKDICKTQEMAFKELLVHNMSYDNSTLSVVEKELKSFFKELLAMRQQIYELMKRMLGDTASKNSTFTGNDFWGGFDGFPLKHNETEIPNDKKETNQIEKE